MNQSPARCLIAVILAAGPGTGQESTNTSAMSTTLTLDLPSQYFFRGFLQQDRGFVASPSTTAACFADCQTSTHRSAWSSRPTVNSMVAATAASTRSWASSPFSGSPAMTTTRANWRYALFLGDSLSVLNKNEDIEVVGSIGSKVTF